LQIPVNWVKFPNGYKGEVMAVEDHEFLSKLVVGIGEVSTITGIPQRQIHYWEGKDIIKPVDDGSSVRRYSYATIKKMILIKELIDEGFTLEASVRKVDERIKKIDSAVAHLKARSSKAAKKRTRTEGRS
jgi:DNA-binding transcriptional MerR regulator